MVVTAPLPLPLLSGTMTNSRHAYPEHRQRDARTPENTGTVRFPTTAPFSSSPAGTHDRHLGTIPVQDSQQDASQAHIHNVRRPISVSPNFRKQSNSIFYDAQRAGVTPDRSRQMRDLMTKYENLEVEYEIEKLHRARLQNLQSKLQKKIAVEREESDDKDMYYKEIIESMQTTGEREIEELKQKMEDMQLEFAAKLEEKRKQGELEQELRQKLTDANRSEKATSEKCSSLQRELESLKQKDIPTENEKRLCREMYDTTLELDSLYESVLKDDKVHDKAFKDNVKRLQEETEQRKNCTWPP